MMQEQEHSAPQERDVAPVQQQQQQQQQPAAEGHAGRGSDSAMKQMRAWEQRRASQSGRGRQGPN